jgi:multiple sugar transport system substrate-binding protein
MARTSFTSTSAGLTRRRLLVGAGGAVAAAAVGALSGCGGAGGGGTDTSGGGGVPEAGMKIPDAKVALPTGDIQFRLMDSNDTKAPFWKEFFAAYQEKHPNIECTYDGLPWNRIEEVAPLGIRNGTAHDVLQLPPTIPLTQAVGEGWVSPVDDLIPDFDAWKASFPEGTFVEGVQLFDGKLYSVPLASDRRYVGALHYSTELMGEAGYDPQAKRLTWDDYRDAAKKITKNGRGRAYGLVLEVGQPPRLTGIVRYLAVSAGLAAVGDFDPKTGEYVYDADEIAGAIELLMALNSDGSIFPGSATLTAPESWPRVVRGNAGTVFAGPWVTVAWNTQEPDFEFGVAEVPMDGSDPKPQGYALTGTDGVVVFSKSKAKEVAGDVLSYVTSMAGQTAWGKIVGVGNPPILEEANKAIASGLTPQATRCQELANGMVAAPNLLVGNPDIDLVNRELKPLTPDFGQIIQSALVGKTPDVKKALRDLKDRAMRTRDQAIAAATKNGAKVSTADWAFPNWDPFKDYTTADYQLR